MFKQIRSKAVVMAALSLMLMMSACAASPTNTSADALSGNPVWNDLPAVKEGRLIQASSNMFWFNDIISMSIQLDIITNAVLATKK